MKQPHEDQILQATCEAIIAMAAQALDSDPAASELRIAETGPVVGKRVMIDAKQDDDLVNKCRVTVLDPSQVPGGEIVRIEYEHDKKTDSGASRRVYSIQSVRRKDGELVLLEDFMADTAWDVREADFRKIRSEKYAQEVLKTVGDWVRYRQWQLQQK